MYLQTESIHININEEDYESPMRIAIKNFDLARVGGESNKEDVLFTSMLKSVNYVPQFVGKKYNVWQLKYNACPNA